MDGEAVEKIVEMAKRGFSVTVDGKIFTPFAMSQVIHDPKPEALSLNTLTGLVDFILNTFNDDDRKKLIVAIKSPVEVSVYDLLNSETMSRRKYLTAYVEKKSGMRLNDWIDHESFMISLRSLFANSGDRQTILEFASRIIQGAAVTVSDDGVSQDITSNKGISGALKENQKAPSIVKLTPYRTFREVEQPESEFIFRLKSGGEKLPYCMLAEADGGAWELKAIQKIAEFLKSKLTGITVIA